MRSSIDLIMRGLKAAETMRRSRAWRGLSMLIMEPKKSSISSGMSMMEVAPVPGLEDLGMPAGLGDVGVPRQRVVALAPWG